MYLLKSWFNYTWMRRHLHIICKTVNYEKKANRVTSMQM